jgi:16S rRNA (adenine(1408)-N(1))-methyltransferase
MEDLIKTVVGKKTLPIYLKEFLQQTEHFDKRIIDLGTGDGRFIFTNAQRTPQILFIGVDTLANLMEEYSYKADKKNLGNAVFVLGSADKFIEGVSKYADFIYVNLPWGSLLKFVIDADEVFLANIYRLLKSKGKLIINLGYTQEVEQKEIDKLQLPPLSEIYIQNTLAKKYEVYGFKLISLKELKKEEISEIGTTWAKRLKYGKDRPVFSFVFELSL